jgi:hypothetical protein
MDFSTPAPISIGTPAATPIGSLEYFTGDIRALWESPWDVEGKLIEFNAIIKGTQIAGSGQGIPVGLDRQPYLAVFYLEVPDAGRALFAATNADLTPLENLHTVHVIGSYAGEHGPGWTEPLVIANLFEPVPIN